MLHSLNALPVTDFSPAWNYLVEENPFGLTGPPVSFLHEMWTFDPCLVIFPSREEAVYRLARRIEHGQPLLTWLRSRPDTKMFVRHRLTPVTSIVPFARWGPVLLHDLAVRDIRRVGGFRQAADLLDQQDAEAEQQFKNYVTDQATIRARASWRGQKWTRGETVALGDHRRHHARTDPRRQHFRPAYRPAHAGEGALFVGRDVPLQEVTPYVEVDSGVPERRSLIVAA